MKQGLYAPKIGDTVQLIRRPQGEIGTVTRVAIGGLVLVQWPTTVAPVWYHRRGLKRAGRRREVEA